MAPLRRFSKTKLKELPLRWTRFHELTFPCKRARHNRTSGKSITLLIYGGLQLSPQNLFTHGKINFATAKSISSQQNQFRRGKINFATAKSISQTQNQFSHSKIDFSTAKSILHTAQSISQYGKVNFAHDTNNFTIRQNQFHSR